MSTLDPEHVSRTSLLFMRRAGDAAVGAEWHQAFALRIIASTETCSHREGQAAVITAVKTAVRALSFDNGDSTSRVTVALLSPEQPVLGGPSAGLPLGEIVQQEGAGLATELEVDPATPTIILGQPPAEMAPGNAATIATWTDWTAEVSPYSAVQPDSYRSDGNVLAAIAAGALAVAAAFFHFARLDDDNLCQDALRFDLWSPEQPEGRVPPKLRYAPAQWWLLGLGHLGQAYAHAISWLDYAIPAEVDVALQDVQRTVPANHSTGLFTPRGSDGRHKTRLVADALERCGLNTSIIERLMDESTAVRASDMHVALVGVDNLATRRSIDTFGWRTAIDVGIGTGADDFDGITLVRFPGRASASIPAWQETAPGAKPPAGDVMVTRDLDPCGVARLNGIAVGASFVGTFAGVLAVTEALRPLHGGTARSVLCLSIRDAEIDGAQAVQQVEPPVALELRE
ncbi:hypothetical protein [Kribbella kalugense]|uniref:Thiamine biosynthesis protein ThiF n=1 Tax=Kribbella kalugense TaxID=2512221 RepID=A0A4R7ZNK3_9ACTN|nr:hypothetical protein [Kribbella kalugense]TDW19453.1 hypothetical protein EV650_6062 [Kribbella kalugense]